MTALLGEATSFLPGYVGSSPAAPSDLTALYRDTALLRPPYRGTPASAVAAKRAARTCRAPPSGCRLLAVVDDAVIETVFATLVCALFPPQIQEL